MGHEKLTTNHGQVNCLILDDAVVSTMALVEVIYCRESAEYIYVNGD